MWPKYLVVLCLWVCLARVLPQATEIGTFYNKAETEFHVRTFEQDRLASNSSQIGEHSFNCLYYLFLSFLIFHTLVKLFLDSELNPSRLMMEEMSIQVQDILPALFDNAYPLSSFSTIMGADDISLLGGIVRHSNGIFAMSASGYNLLEGQVQLVKPLGLYSFGVTDTIGPPTPDAQFFGRSIAFEFPWLVVSSPAYDLQLGAAFMYRISESGEATLNATLPSRGVSESVCILENIVLSSITFMVVNPSLRKIFIDRSLYYVLVIDPRSGLWSLREYLWELSHRGNPQLCLHLQVLQL